MPPEVDTTDLVLAIRVDLEAPEEPEVVYPCRQDRAADVLPFRRHHAEEDET